MTLLAVSTQEVIEAILGSIDEAIHAVDENGITIFYNTVAAKHDGSKIEKVLGKHLLEAFPSLSRETSTLMKVLDTKTNRSSSAALSKFKWRRHLHSKYDVTYFIDGNIAGAVEIAKDYSTVQKLTDTIVDLQSKIKRSSRKSNQKACCI